MDRLWSPWRYRYVSRASPTDTCIFCDKAATSSDEEEFIVARGRHNFVLLNIFPYTNGHMMIAPYAHAASLAEASQDGLVELVLLARHAEAVLRAVYRAPGLNLGMNVGECAGAGVAGHIHLHILPRWPGDSSFMTTVGETRVLPESLGETWTKLRAAWKG
jgi:ATP adenylyltransferase